MGEYVYQHLNLKLLGKAQGINPRSEPESGNPTFRDRRGAAGNVTYVNRCARLHSIPTNGKQL